MAVNIGPKIGIDGEKEYRQSINQIIQQQKTLKSEMKAVSSAWTKETSELKKNKQQKEQLNKQIENQNKKVKELSRMLEESAKKYGENDARTLKWAQAVNEATAELNDLKKELSEIPNPLQTVGKQMEEAGDKISGASKKVSDFGGALTKGVTAPIVAVGGLAVASFNEVDGALDTVIKKTGATGDTLAGLEASMKNVAASVPTDFATAGAAIGDVNTMFGVTGQELEELTTAFIKFAELNDTDVSSSIMNVQGAVAAFGLETDDVISTLDILNTVGQNTGIGVDDLAGKLQDGSVIFQQLGFNINQSAGFLGSLNKAGIDSDTVMTGLQKALKNATEEGKTMDQALAELQATLQNAENDTDAMSAAIDLFGAKAGPQMAAAIQEGRISFVDYENTVIGWGDSVSKTFDATLDPADTFKMTMNELKTVGAELGGVIMEMAVPALQKITEVVKGAKEWWEGLDDGAKKNVVTFGGIAAAIGPVVTVIGKLGGVISTVVKVGGTLITVLGGMNPVVLGVSAVIAGLVAAGVALYENWDTVKEKCAELKDNLTEKWDSLKEHIGGAIEKIKGFMNFEWHFPELKAPHFVITGDWNWHTFPPETPHIDVEWYAKAMNNGMILNRPTIFGASGGHLLGGGEVGSEVVVGANSLVDMIAGAVQSAFGPSTNNYGGNTINVYGAPGQNVEELARKISNIINSDVSNRGAVWA